MRLKANHLDNIYGNENERIDFMSETSYNVSGQFNNKALKDFLAFYHLGGEKLKNASFLVNNKEVYNLGQILKQDDIITILYEEDIDFPVFKKYPNIVYEDDYLLIVNKPKGLMVHPDSKDKNGCLVNMVAWYYFKKGIKRSIKYLHRIDTDTTGLVIFAKDILTAAYFNFLISEHIVKRTYLAIVSGFLELESGLIDEPIGEDRHDNQRRRVSKTGKRAVTHYETLKQLAHRYSLVKLVLETGRTHQIRVHMRYLGHPLAGDTLYGGSTKYIERQALHSFSLDFKHPYTFEDMHIEAPLPQDMEKLI